MEKDALKEKKKCLTKFIGPLKILWPCAFKGLVSSKGKSSPAYFLKRIVEMLLNGVKIVDSYIKSPEEIAGFIFAASSIKNKELKKKPILPKDLAFCSAFSTLAQDKEQVIF